MHPAYERLITRVHLFGNPARKYLRAVEQHGELLLARLEATEALSHVAVDRTSPAPAEDFERVTAAGRDPEEKLVLLGTFYSIQFLHQNARALERLAVDLAAGAGDHHIAYAAFLGRIEEEFTLLVSTYIGQILKVVLPPGAGPFAILSVGTSGHQDDIDVAFIDGGSTERRQLDQAFARLAGQCLRYASPLDNYVASEADTTGFSMRLEELNQALGSGRLGYVVVTELLGAELLAGDPHVLERLRAEVTAEYCFQPDSDNYRHEIYLRGLLGETRGLLITPPAPDRLNPKDDALRLILGLAAAFKTIHCLTGTRCAGLLAELKLRNSDLAPHFARLEASRVFLETFRQIAQLLVTQEEELAVEGEAERRNLARVAAALGYRDWGPVHAVDHLLVHYHEAVEAAHAAAKPLMDEVARHLTRISRFSQWLRTTPPANLAAELAETLAAGTRVFRAARFYDDLLAAFAPDGVLLEAFVSSYTRLPLERRRTLAQLYAEWGRDAPYAFLTVLSRVAAGRNRREVDPASEIADTFLSGLADFPEAVRALSRVFRYYPALANRFLLALAPHQLEQLARAIQVPIGNPEVAAARDRFHALITAHRESSHYFRRVLARVTERHPATVQAISADATMRTLALGQLATSERHPSPDKQKEFLGDYYDIEFLRIAMGTLRGQPDRLTRVAFTELTRTYLGRLFGFCFREAERRPGSLTLERDRIGVLLSGGNARGRPYDEDYDLLVVVDSTNPEDWEFAERVVTAMNRQIARRGVIAQYRLGEWIRRFAITVDNLADLLAQEHDELFVDRCQLLGSRILVGSRRLEAELRQRVLGPQIFAKSGAFSARVLREISDRHRFFRPLPPTTIHLKEHPGGFRDIDLCLAIAEARLGIWDASSGEIFDALVRADPGRTDLYERLRIAYDFLVAVRSVYRVAVTASDEIEREQLGGPARILGYEDRYGPGADGFLFTDVERRLAEAATLVDEIIGTPIPR